MQEKDANPRRGGGRGDTKHGLNAKQRQTRSESRVHQTAKGVSERSRKESACAGQKFPRQSPFS